MWGQVSIEAKLVASPEEIPIKLVSDGNIRVWLRG